MCFCGVYDQQVLGLLAVHVVATELTPVRRDSAAPLVNARRQATCGGSTLRLMARATAVIITMFSADEPVVLSC